MSQPQPISLPHYRARSIEVGCYQALKEASEDVDNLTDQLGRWLDLLKVIRGTTFVAGIAFGLFIAWMAACTTTIDMHSRVVGWPELTIYEHHVPHRVMRDRCAKYTPVGMYPEACAEFNFARNRCDLWFSADFPPSKAVIEHERLHCQGYQHPGDNSMELMLRKYRGR